LQEVRIKELEIYSLLIAFVLFQEFHPGPVPMCNLSNKTMTISLGKNQFQTTTHHAPHHMKYKGNDFFVEICRCNDKALWHFWVFFVGNRADATQYLYRIKVQ
jgi:hypothetical protein